MKERYNDTDLREALRRKYAEEPELPEDFVEQVMKRSEAEGPQRSEAFFLRSAMKASPFVAERPTTRWRWMAAAACVLIIIGIGWALKERFPASELDAAGSRDGLTALSEAPADQRVGLTDLSEAPADQRGSLTDFSEAPADPCEGIVLEEPADPNLHYASNTTVEEDTVAYQDPARVDDFIAKLAEYHQVKEGELTCSATQDGSVVSRVYVFPDKQEIDLFGRLLQVACQYSDKTPGYVLYFSHQQFFFELKDIRKQLHYRWIAERINGKILLYSTCSPLGITVSSACYQDYCDQLMHTKSVHTKTIDL